LSPERETTIRRRENHSRDFRKADFRLRLRAGFTVPNFWRRDSNPRQTVYQTVALPLSYNEPAYAQNCDGELPPRLPAGSNLKLVRKPGFAPGPFASRAKMLLITPQS
jgi:hypothetical protein